VIRDWKSEISYLYYGNLRQSAKSNNHLNQRSEISRIIDKNYTKMGKGDKKTRKGKIAIGSYGKTRPHDKKKPEPVVAEAAPAAKVKEAKK
jgi:30S ribosomal protein S31